MPSLMAVGLARAKTLGDFHDFLEPAGAALGVNAGRGPLAALLVVESAADPGSDDQASAGNQVHRGHRLGHQDGMAQRGQQDRRAEPDPAGAGGQRPQASPAAPGGAWQSGCRQPTRNPARPLRHAPPFGRRGRRWKAVLPARGCLAWEAARRALVSCSLISSTVHVSGRLSGIQTWAGSGSPYRGGLGIPGSRRSAAISSGVPASRVPCAGRTQGRPQRPRSIPRPGL